ncbi:hypothetical protein G7Y89_g1251 [Cudoniella acicularis]|uniref:Uncharacterized protein n=1 Tax=Cudoniella acicularis TaxID=354080 RepID=A0A8H4RVP0_9HELO|nr:hypothetical protein G7Y89_g1251 [Cudoniella acicularis]
MDTKSPKAPKPMADYKQLSKVISIYKPPTEKSNPTSHQSSTTPQCPPSMVILCTWLGGATPRRISKYTDKYKNLLPHAQIMVIETTTPDMMTRSFSEQQRRLSPAREAIRSLFKQNPSATILLHFFSNSGGNQALQLAKSLNGENEPLSKHLQAVIFDCVPGRQDFVKGYNALLILLPQATVLRLLGKMVMFTSMCLITSLMKTGLMSSIDTLRVELQKEEVFGKGAKRLYMYLKGDEMLDSTAAAQHAVEARGLGYDVETLAFEKGGHCALILSEGKKYWDAVRQLWEANDGKLEEGAGHNIAEAITKQGEGLELKAKDKKTGSEKVLKEPAIRCKL